MKIQETKQIKKNLNDQVKGLKTKSDNELGWNKTEENKYINDKN